MAVNRKYQNEERGRILRNDGSDILSGVFM